MSAVENEIIERLHTLDEPKLLEVLDFVEFVAQRRRAITKKGMLSSSDEADQPNVKPIFTGTLYKIQ